MKAHAYRFDALDLLLRCVKTSLRSRWTYYPKDNSYNGCNLKAPVEKLRSDLSYLIEVGESTGGRTPLEL